MGSARLLFCCGGLSCGTYCRARRLCRRRHLFCYFRIPDHRHSPEGTGGRKILAWVVLQSSGKTDFPCAGSGTSVCLCCGLANVASRPVREARQARCGRRCIYFQPATLARVRVLRCRSIEQAATAPLVTGNEEQFYIIWPLLLLLAHRLKLHLLGMLAIVVVLSFAFSVWQTHVDSVAAFYSPFSRFWELGIGGLLACHSLRNLTEPTPRWWSETKAILGLAFIALVVVILNQDSKFPGWWALMPTVGATLLISAGPDAWINRKILSLRGMVAVGLMSYPLYLWHWPLLTFLRIHESGDPSKIAIAAIVLLSFALAWLTYQVVEKPVRFRRAAHPKFRLAAVCAPLAVICGAGLVVSANAGFSSRFPGQIQALATFKYDPSIVYRSHHCFLTATDPASALQGCADGDKAPGKPVVLLWGDSYAAALYPGYKHVLAGKARLSCK